MTNDNGFAISNIDKVKLQVLELIDNNIEVISLKDALECTQRVIDVIIDEDNRKHPCYDAGNRAVAGIVENDIEGVLKFLVNYADGTAWDKSIMEALRVSNNNALELINRSFVYDTNGAYVDFITVEVSDKLIIVEAVY